MDGELVVRILPGLPHGFTQDSLAAGIRTARGARLSTASQVRLQVSATRYRVPDLMVFADELPKERYPSQPPFGVIEILSPDDSQNEMIDKLDEYASLNIPYIWVVDPNHRRIYRYDHGSLLQQDALAVPERGLRLEPSAIFG